MKKVAGRLMLMLLLALVLGVTLTACGSDRIDIRRFEGTPEALTELVNGGVDAVVADSPVVLEFIKENPNANLKAFPDDEFEKEFYGIAMRQEDTELHELINEGLQRVKDNGTYDKIFNEYFGDGSDFEVPESENTLGVTYNVAQDMAYAPFEYLTPAGEPEGFDCDLIRAIAAEMGFEVDLINTAWDGIIPSLLAGNSDMIISAMTITEERQESVTFSDPYFEATQYIAVKEGSDIESLADLEGKSVGVQNGTTGDIAVSKYFGLEVNE